jgi:hypothetical protein
VDTSLHVGIVEDDYSTGYLVTIEGDALHGVGRYVVPIRDPQRIGEAGPIYAYASPVGHGGGAGAASATAAGAFGPLTGTGVDWPAVNGVRRRTLRSLRAFQHMPYRTAHVRIDWTGVTRGGLVDVRVSSNMSIASAQEAWLRFLHRFHDAGHAYVVTFHQS